MVQRVWLFSKRFFVGSLVGLLCAVPAIAQREINNSKQFEQDIMTSR